jgi:hypothetical protein
LRSIRPGCVASSSGNCRARLSDRRPCRCIWWPLTCLAVAPCACPVTQWSKPYSPVARYLGRFRRCASGRPI